MNLHIMPLSNIFSSMSRRFAVVACAALLFASCDNISLIDSSEEDEKIDGKCIVTFGIAENIDSRAVTGTVLPTSVDTSTLSYKLQAALPEDTELPANALPEDLGEGKDYASYEDLQAASFNLDSGKWIFYLFAYKSGELVLTGEETVNIKAGANPVVFNMVASESGTGSVKVILNCYLGSETCSEITGVTATFLRPNGTALAEGTLTQQTPRFTTADDSGIEYTDSSGKAYTLVEYENTAVPKGSYLLKFEITLQYETIATDGKTTIYNTTTSYYTVGVTVEPGSLSEKTDDITDLKQRYSITYMNVKDDGTTEPFTDWDDGAEPVTYYNPNSTQAVSLPSRNVISRTDKSFTGWYDSYTEGTYGALTTSFTPKNGGTSTVGAKVYYAKWGDLDLYVSAAENSSLGGGNNTTGDGSESAPYLTLRKAITYISENSNDKLEWTVHIDGKVQGLTVESDIGDIKQLTITGYSPSTGEGEDFDDALTGTGTGKVFAVSISKPVIIKNLTITGGVGADGSGLNIGEGANVILNNVAVTDNTTNDNGGGILNAGTLTLENCSITKNEASGYGGGVYNKGTLYIYGETVIGGSIDGQNIAAKSGGGIDNDGKSKVYIGYSSYTSAEVNTPVPFTGSISYNIASGTAGGGVYNQGTFIMKGGSIGNNKAPVGAGVYNVVGSNTGLCSLSEITVSGNKASSGNGGAIWNDGTLTVTDVTMSENTAVTDGGGIYSTGDSASLTITQGIFISNEAGGSGGAVWSGGEITLSGGEFSSNIATSGSGGALYCESDVTAGNQIKLNENQAAQSGGAIYAVGNVIASDGSIIANEAGTFGGAIYIAGTSSQLENLVISGNKAETGSGGGIYIANGAGATLTGMTIGATDSANTALTGGGVYNAGALTVIGGTTAYNIASANGAAAGAGIYSVGELTITGNASVSDNNATYGWGGGVYNAGTFIVQAADSGSPSISSNKAVNGAGVYTNGTNALFTMSAGTIGGNAATNSGGGVYNAGMMFMYGSAVVGDSETDSIATSKQAADTSYSNYAPIGGGVYNTGSLCLGYASLNEVSDLSGGVYHNSADSGGGIANVSGATLSVNSGYIKNNYAGSYGGGIHNAGVFTFTGGTINRNKTAKTGHGGGVYNAGTMTMVNAAVVGDNSDVSENATKTKYANYSGNGGGIYNATSCTLTLGTAENPLTGGVYYNYADGDGGGVYNAGTFTISSGYILHNGVAEADEGEAATTAGVRTGDSYTNSVTSENGSIQSD